MKRIKRSEKTDSLASGLKFLETGFPTFEKHPPNRREGKLWQRTVVRYMNDRKHKSSGSRKIVAL